MSTVKFVSNAMGVDAVKCSVVHLRVIKKKQMSINEKALLIQYDQSLVDKCATPYLIGIRVNVEFYLNQKSKLCLQE